MQRRFLPINLIVQVDLAVLNNFLEQLELIVFDQREQKQVLQRPQNIVSSWSFTLLMRQHLEYQLFQMRKDWV